MAARPRARRFSGRRGSRTPKARRSSGFGPGAVASRLALPFVSLDGWIRTSVLRFPKPADEARLSYIQIRSVGPEGLEPSPRWLRARDAAANTWIPSFRPAGRQKKPGVGETPGRRRALPEGPGVRAAGGSAGWPGGRPVPPSPSDRSTESDSSCAPKSFLTTSTPQGRVLFTAAVRQT